MENRQQLDLEWKKVKERTRKYFQWFTKDFELNPQKNFNRLRNISISSVDGQTSLWADLWRWAPEGAANLHRYRIAVQILYDEEPRIGERIIRIPEPEKIKSVWVWALADLPPRAASWKKVVAINKQVVDDERVKILTD